VKETRTISGESRNRTVAATRTATRKKPSRTRESRPCTRNSNHARTVLFLCFVCFFEIGRCLFFFAFCLPCLFSFAGFSFVFVGFIFYCRLERQVALVLIFDITEKRNTKKSASSLRFVLFLVFFVCLRCVVYACIACCVYVYCVLCVCCVC